MVFGSKGKKEGGVSGERAVEIELSRSVRKGGINWFVAEKEERMNGGGKWTRKEGGRERARDKDNKKKGKETKKKRKKRRCSLMREGVFLVRKGRKEQKQTEWQGLSGSRERHTGL